MSATQSTFGFPSSISQLWHRCTSWARTTPSCVIIGSSGSDTQFLVDQLRRHPGCDIPRSPAAPEQLQGSFEYRYLARFPLEYRVWEARGVCFDHLPLGFEHPAAIDGLHSLLADLKIVAVVTEPALRTYRGYLALSQNKRRELSFRSLAQQTVDGAVQRDSELAKITAADIYLRSAAEILKRIPVSNLLLIDGGAAASETSDQLRQILQHVSLDTWPQLHARNVENPLGHPESEEDRGALEMLRSYYRPLEHQLAQLVGTPLPWHQQEASPAAAA